MSDNIPDIKFQQNQNLEIEMATYFLTYSGGGIDFGEGIVKLYPELKPIRKFKSAKRKEQVEKFVKKYYSSHRKSIEVGLQKMKTEWYEVSEDFSSATKSLFPGQSWPQGEYICYLSIFDCNPRFLENKTFQVYYKHQQGTNHVIAHEMLHFIYYDYLESEEKVFSEKIGEERSWLLSEIFNDLVLALPVFRNFAPRTNSSYPEAKELLTRISSQLNPNNFTAKEFIEASKKVL
jgi:hypothetical protein